MGEARTIDLSGLDEQRFGVRTAKALFANLKEVEEGLAFCRENNVTFLMARCPGESLEVAHALEHAGCYLTDVLVYYNRDLTKGTGFLDMGTVTVRLGGPADADGVAKVAGHAFRGYKGHYHADPRLDPVACDEVYVDWARRSCASRAMVDEVLVAEDMGSILGFATLRLNSAEEGEGVLFGVSPEAQGRGLYRSLMVQGMNWCARRRCTRMVVSTQINNIAVQKVWVRIGFEPGRSCLTFHGWFGV